MKLLVTLIFALLLTLNNLTCKTDAQKADELTLRNQLFADVFLLKEGVDRLQISVEVLNKRFNNQMEILKGLQSRLSTDDDYSESESGICSRITNMFNTTLRKHNILEGRLVTKLEELNSVQTIRLNEILMKQNLNKNFNSQAVTDTLSEVVVKIENVAKIVSLQQTQFEKFVLNQSTTLQAIYEKLSKNQEQLEAMGQELAGLQELKIDINKFKLYSRPKLPKEFILGLASSNITGLK